MNWKTELQLIDLDGGRRIEVTCRTCGRSRYENPALLSSETGMPSDYLDEVERKLACRDPGCRGPVKIALPPAGDAEGFTGGLA